MNASGSQNFLSEMPLLFRELKMEDFSLETHYGYREWKCDASIMLMIKRSESRQILDKTVVVKIRGD